MATKSEIKSKVKAKAKAIKAKVKGKVKRGKVALAALALLPVVGCMDTAPASRATTATFGDIGLKVCVDGGTNTTVNASITLGDAALASADSAGSTETQTATPTVDVRTRIDARYNDALAAASTASRGVIAQIADGVTGVLDLMASGKSGKVAVTRTDGTAATVQCEGGQCSFCEECAP